MIAFIGLGNMGFLMCANLVKNGFDVLAYDILGEKREKAAEASIPVAESPAEAARDRDVIITMLPQTTDTKEALFGENGAAATLCEGGIVIDMGTGSPSMERSLGDLLEERKIRLIDAPVSGGVAKAGDATLSIMASGDREAYESVLPILNAMGEEVFYVGDLGTGQTIKIINNMLTGVNLAAASEAMVLGSKAGLDPELLLRIINSSSGMSYSSKVKISNFVLKRNFDGGFKARLQHKDMNLATTLARELEVPTIIANAAQEFYLMAMAEGKGDMDASVIVTLMEEMANTEVEVKQ